MAESVAFVRSRDARLFPEGDFPGDVEDSTSGQNAPDIELFACARYSQLSETLLTPCSGPFAYINHGLAPAPAGPTCCFGGVLLR